MFIFLWSLPLIVRGQAWTKNIFKKALAFRSRYKGSTEARAFCFKAKKIRGRTLFHLFQKASVRFFNSDNIVPQTSKMRCFLFFSPVYILSRLYAFVNIWLILVDHPVAADLAGGFESAAQSLLTNSR